MFLFVALVKSIDNLLTTSLCFVFLLCSTPAAATTNAKVCYDPASSGFYTDTTMTLTAVVTEITAVDVSKVGETRVRHGTCHRLTY